MSFEFPGITQELLLKQILESHGHFQKNYSDSEKRRNKENKEILSEIKSLTNNVNEIDKKIIGIESKMIGKIEVEELIHVGIQAHKLELYESDNREISKILMLEIAEHEKQFHYSKKKNRDSSDSIAITGVKKKIGIKTIVALLLAVVSAIAGIINETMLRK